MKIVNNKSYITDCEGPLTLNDNAYEIAQHFLKKGGQLFKILSLYDDYLVDIVKKDEYKAGGTLKFIIPFFLEEGLTNKKMIDFSVRNILMVKDSEFLVDYLKNLMNFYIVSTSYKPYIEALTDYIDLPFENAFYSDVDIDVFDITNDEKEKIKKFKDLILENPHDYELFNNIFFNEIPKMSFYSKMEEISIVGGEGKKIAIESLIKDKNINKNEILYIGDSITDVEPLKFVFENNGLSISFNGNQYSLKAAEIAIVSSSAIISVIIADIFNRFNKTIVLNFIHEYNNSDLDIYDLFKKYNVSKSLVDKFSKEDLILIDIINEKNFHEILNKSVEMRDNIRGQEIASLS